MILFDFSNAISNIFAYILFEIITFLRMSIMKKVLIHKKGSY